MDEIKWERILVTTDFSKFAEKAVRYAHELAEKFGAELHVLHVVRDLSEAVADHGAYGIIEQGSSEDDQSRWLATLVGEPGTVRRIESLRVGTDVPDVVVEYSRKQNIDLIVMATHGRSGLTHMLMGSVTEKVLRQTPCPVLVIRG